MIARLEVTRGTLTEYPLAERTKNGWQNGVTFYPDAEVTKVTPLHIVASAPQGEPSDAISIPRPHVPYGPIGIPEHMADADYLDHAAASLEGHYEVGGSNVRATVVKLLRDTAAALRAAAAVTKQVKPSKHLCSDAALQEMIDSPHIPEARKPAMRAEMAQRVTEQGEAENR